MRKVLGLLLLLSVVSAAWAQERQDTIVVSRDGTGNFRTLQEAIESARAFMDYTVTIYVKNGVYKEKVIVPSWVENIDIIYFYYLTSSLKADTEIFTHILSNLKNTCYGSEKSTKSRP